MGTTEGQGLQSPNYTQVPNEIFALMPEMKECELKVVLAIVRKTVGWRKIRDKISLSQLCTDTGLSKPSVEEGVSLAMERGIVQREPVSTKTDRLGYYYSLRFQEEDSNDEVGKNFANGRQKSCQPVGKNFAIQKKGKEKKKENDSPPANGAGEQEGFDFSDTIPVIEVVVVGEEEYVPPADPPKKPRKRTTRDDVFDAIMELWGVGEGEAIRMTNQMMGTVPQKDREYRCRFDKPTTPDEVRKFVAWYKQHNPGASTLPKNAGKLQTHYYNFRKSTEQEVKLAAEGKKFIPGVGYVKTY